MKKVEVLSREGVKWFENRLQKAIDWQEGPTSLAEKMEKAWLKGIIEDELLWSKSQTDAIAVGSRAYNWEYWIYKDVVYTLKEKLPKENAKLLVIDHYDKEQKKFTRLRAKRALPAIVQQW